MDSGCQLRQRFKNVNSYKNLSHKYKLIHKLLSCSYEIIYREMRSEAISVEGVTTHKTRWWDEKELLGMYNILKCFFFKNLLFFAIRSLMIQIYLIFQLVLLAAHCFSPLGSCVVVKQTAWPHKWIIRVKRHITCSLVI